MKIRELRQKSTKELIKLKEQLEFNRTRASSIWGIRDMTSKDAGSSNIGGVAHSGDKTSLRKDIRRTIAQINTLLKEREIKRRQDNENS